MNKDAKLQNSLLICGKWIEASSVMPVYNPSNNEIITHVAKANTSEVNLAVEAAQNAFSKWYEIGIKKRIEYVKELIEKIEENKEHFAKVDSINSGNPISGMRRDVNNAIDRMYQAIYFAGNIEGSTIEASNVGNLHYTKYEPYGVVARIVAFNHPFLFAATKIVQPLLMGNTVVLKPSDYTPLSALELGRYAKDIFPPGVINIVTGDSDTGSEIVRHPNIKRIGFTGSAKTGQIITTEAASVGIKHISMELGGKNPMIVFPDSDIKKAVKASLIGMGYGSVQGQSCGSNSRLFLHKSIFDEFIGQLLTESKRLNIGDPLNEETRIGPLISKSHLRFVRSRIDDAVQDGANLVYGGDTPQHLTESEGNYITPAILTNVNQQMKIANEEIFGPVLSVFIWDDYDELINDLNNIDYGLTASIWTENINLAHKTANKIRAGYIWINHTAEHFNGMPFGGYKNSGIGREESKEELLSYCETKSVNLIVQN